MVKIEMTREEAKVILNVLGDEIGRLLMEARDTEGEAYDEIKSKIIVVSHISRSIGSEMNK